MGSASGRILANEIIHRRPAGIGDPLTGRAATLSDIGSSSAGPGLVRYTSGVVDGEQLFDFVGIHWIVSPAQQDWGHLELRTSRDGAMWSGWMSVTHNEHLRDDDRNELFAGPYAVAASRYVQYRVIVAGGHADGIEQIALTLMDASDLNVTPLARLVHTVRSAVARMGPAYADAAPVGSSRILTRQDWAADESLMQWPPRYQKVQKFVIHHTVTSDGGANVAAAIRSIYYYHAVTRGWGDIGYNYIVDKYGNIWTGRQGGDNTIAGHAYGWNNGSIGIAALGDYSIAQPTSSLQGAIANIIAMKARQFGIQPYGNDTFTHQEQASGGSWVNVTSNGPNVLGHRDANYVVGQSGGQTSCPGNGIYDLLDGLRRLAQSASQNGYMQLPYLEPSLPRAGYSGATLQVTVVVSNRGASPIPAGTAVSYRVYRGGALVPVPAAAGAIPTAIGRGATMAVNVPFTVPVAGSYIVRFDLKTGGQWWNDIYGTPVREIAFRSAEWSVYWTSDNVPRSWVAGETRAITINLTNDGGRAWPAAGATPVRLGYKWVNSATGNVFSGANRAPFASDVQPGQAVVLTIPITAPIFPTDYTLLIDLYKEGEFAFADKGVEADGTPVGVSVDFKATYSVPIGSVLQVPTFTAAQIATVPVTISNTGRGVFPTTSSYPVNLAYHWKDGAGRVVLWDGLRTRLPGDLAPGQSVTVDARVPAPPVAGGYVLEFDLVQEGVAWFSGKGVVPGSVAVKVTGELTPVYGATYQPAPLGLAAAGAAVSVLVGVTNTSNFGWPAAGANPIALSYHWIDSSGATIVWDGPRTRLGGDLAPGGSAQLVAAVRCPAAPGTYTLKWDLVHEGVSWFSGKGVATADQTVQVSAPESLVYGASLDVRATPAALPPGVASTFDIRVQNLSSFDWGPDINLSYHWYDASGAAVVWDGLRTALAGVKVDEVRAIKVNVLAPATTGIYSLRYDIAHERQTWFSTRGMQTPTRVVNVAVPPYAAAYVAPASASGPRGTSIQIPVAVLNRGSQMWEDGAVNLSYHLNAASGATFVWNGARTALGTNVARDQSVTLSAVILLPATPGTYTIRLDLVREGVTWFSDQGVPPGPITLVVE